MLEGSALDKIRRYVNEGGYLFTEDWALKEILDARFGEFVKLGNYISEMEVNILPKPGAATHPFLRRVFIKPPKMSGGGTMSESDFEKVAHTWKIDNESPSIKIMDKSKVTVLIYSPDVGEKAGNNGSDAVAITFAVNPKSGSSAGGDPVASGKPIEQDRAKMSGGRVLHVMSHFGKQKKREDEFTIQNLLINFLVEANERRGLEKLVEKK